MNEGVQIQLSTDCVQLGVTADTWQDAIRKACKPLVLHGHTTQFYPDDVIARETMWPTGLPTTPVAIAIPHALISDNIIRPQIAACVLSAPVPFAQSGGTAEDETLDVQLIFILALKDAQTQLGVLQNLMAVFSDEELLTGLLNANSPEEFIHIFTATP